MEIDFSKRKHESPFADDAPKNESPFADDSSKVEPPPTNELPPISQPKTFAVHSSSEQAQFRIFMGFAFLTVGVPVSVWAYWCLTGREYGGYPDRQWLEGSLCAAVGLLCFAIAGFLFARARRIFRQIKAGKINYELLDPQTIPILKNTIKVEPTKFQAVLLFFLILFFGGTSLLLLLDAVRQPRNLIIAVVNLLILFVICRLIFTAKKKSVRAFEPAGILRGDLRLVPWKDFRGAITRTALSRYGQKYVWRVELALADGKEAWIIPQRIKNLEEVFNFVNTLPDAILKN